MPRRIAPSTAGAGRRVAIVLSRFNPESGEGLLGGALRALKEAGVSAGMLEFGTPSGNGILTCDSDAQAQARMDAKGYEAAQAALELANLCDALDDD